MLRFTWILFGALVTLGIASCETCPQCPQIPIVAGSFETAAPGGPGFGTPAGTFPWDSTSKRLDVDLAQRTVRLAYMRDGHEVIETYRIASMTECAR